MLAVLVTTWVLAAPAAAADTVEVLADRALRARAEGRLSESLELLREAHARSPLPVLLNNIGRALEELGRYAEAADAYRQVAEDPRAPAELRDKDRARLDALAPKLARAWIQLDTQVAGPELLVDGALVSPAPLPEHRVEIGLEPGPHVFERSVDVHETAIAFVDAKLGTTTLVLPSADDACLELPRARYRVAEVVIDGYRVRASLVDLERVRATPGSRTIAVRTDDGRLVSSSAAFTPGARIELFALLAARLGGPPAEVVPIVAEPVPSASAARWAPWVLASSGALAAVGGALLEVSAGDDRDRVRNALSHGPVVHGLTFADADALEQRADTKATFGLVALSVGVTTIAAAAWWWLSE